MDQNVFKSLYNNYRGSLGMFSEAEWDKSLTDWQEYYNLIISIDGLPIDKWVKNSKGYLTDFLDTKEQNFGHARIGNYDQVMVYQYTGSDTKRKDKYIDRYKDTISGDIADVIDSYDNNIKCLIKELATAKTVNDIYTIEQSDEYKGFASKQILRKITILMSVMDTSPYKHQFMWFFNDDSLNSLAQILDVDLKGYSTFLQKNSAIYDIAKDYAGITPLSDKTEYITLYSFLRDLSESGFNSSEISDFNNINVIFNGAPGTGKTYGVTKGIEKLRRMDNNLFRDDKYIQFHPSFSYQDFIEGIKPLGIKDGNLNLQVVNGVFKEFCIKVKKENEKYYNTLTVKPNPEKPEEFFDWPHYFFVVDEINRGNLSNIFGETFTLLEGGYRDYDFSGNYTKKSANLVSTALSRVIASIDENDKLIYKKIGDEVCFGIPFNIHFIGIMNDVDKSIDTFDLALRRRFRWIAKECDYDVIESVLDASGYDSEEVDDYINSCKALNAYITDVKGSVGLGLGKTYEIGHAFFLKIKNVSGRKQITSTKKSILFDNYISGTLKEYVRQIFDEREVDAKIVKAKEVFGAK